MATLADALRVLNDLQAEGVIESYAIGGAMAMLFWAEPIVTFDLDAFVLLPIQPESTSVSLETIYRSLRARGFEEAAEHVVIHGTPVQFLVSPNALADEAIASAPTQELDGVSFRVMAPEHLCALWLQVGGAKRRERVEVLRQAGVVDESKHRDPPAARRFEVTAVKVPGRRARPALALVARQREEKIRWRRTMASRPFKEKICALVEMQERLLPVIARRRALRPWERPWEIQG